MNIRIIKHNEELLFELYSTCIAMGYFKYAKGKIYPRKDLIERLIKNTEIDIILLGHEKFLTINNVRKMITLYHCENKNNFIDWLKQNGYVSYNEVFDCQRKETVFFDRLNKILNPMGYIVKTQYFENNYRYDGYIEDLDLVIEYDENNHINYNTIAENNRELYIKNNHKYLIRINDLHDIYYNIGLVIKKIMLICANLQTA